MFKEWPKIPRYKGNYVTITEKMDGTNACVIIEDGKVIGCQSRSRIITPEDDNYGFANWVSRFQEELLGLGDGYHYGEWVGAGIQKNPHGFDKKYFYLFNSGRWTEESPPPSCCKVVRVLYEGPLTLTTVEEVLGNLSVEAEFEGYKPEGIIIYHHDTRTYSKATYNNPEGKWKQ